MTTWSPGQLERIGAAEEIGLASRRPDGSLCTYVTMWVVRGRITTSCSPATFRP
jgi:hypothetical protein